MPKQKDLKRLVRARMKKTGESYTTARTQLFSKKTSSNGTLTPKAKYAEVAGMSDAAVRKRTGKTWKQWVHALDAIDATQMKHRDIARSVHENFETTDWWAQTVTVGYERIRGLRDLGQRRGGKYDANKSKTFPVPVAQLYRAFGDARKRQRLLPGVDLKIRTSRREKSMRITWPDETKVDVYFVSKGAKKSTVSVQHRELSRKSDVAKAKDYWSERFAALSEIVNPSTNKG
jgi:hypothetical protein